MLPFSVFPIYIGTYVSDGCTLQSMSYGKGDIVSYEYDALERTKKIYYNNNNPTLTYGYVVNGTLGSPEGRSSNCRCACI